jgi:ABC-type antimicrobial peptide transport system permease subunit
VIYKHGSHQNPIILWVYDQKGGPTHVIQGRMIGDSREVVIDWSLAKKFDLKTGDSIIVSDFEFRIAGVTDNSTTMSSPVVFVTYDGLIDMFLESDVIADVSVFPFLSHLLVDLKEGVDPEKIMAEIERSVPEANARRLEQVAQADVNLTRGIFSKPIGFLISISYLAGTLVIGLICFADVAGRLKSFAILKALGFRNSQLIRTVALQTVLLLVAALPLGILLSSLGAWAFETWRPQFLIAVLEPAAIFKTGAAVFLLAIIGSLLPVGSIVRADPAAAFQGN